MKNQINYQPIRPYSYCDSVRDNTWIISTADGWYNSDTEQTYPFDSYTGHYCDKRAAEKQYGAQLAKLYGYNSADFYSRLAWINAGKDYAEIAVRYQAAIQTKKEINHREGRRRARRIAQERAYAQRQEWTSLMNQPIYEQIGAFFA